MDIDEAALRAELKGLRRDEGRTLVKVLACPQLRAALGDPPEGQVVARFDAAIAALGADLRSLALKNAYAIGLRDPLILKTRRENFGAQEVVSRGPETVNNWENEKIEELIAQLAAGTTPPQYEHHMVAVAVADSVISVVAEGEALSGKPMRQLANPNKEPFLPGFMYQLPEYLSPGKLTIAVLFMDGTPRRVFAEATGDLLAFMCGDGKQELIVSPGGIPGIDAAAHVAVHWDEPLHGVFYGVVWGR